MVHAHQQHVLGRFQLQQRHSQQWARGEVERALGVLGGALQRLRFPLCFLREARQVHHLQRHGRRWVDDLMRLTIRITERGPKRFMPPHELIHCAAQ
ncbi:hypothetical protein GCM10012319_59660 [Comamonas sp. KCTC 72670]|nr:hypothetical protein GCM10012319_59660 [Comamonas sp. KCTC 72670]